MKFENLNILDSHIDFISSKSAGLFYAVGGCIRDILLGISKDPEDIDFTTNLDPETLWKNIGVNKSSFRSAKFGTVSLIADKKYEITPLREEGNYMDFRHPGEISWTNNIMHDSVRRDFTINCLYYFKTSVEKNFFSSKNKKTLKVETFLENSAKYCNENIFLSDQNLLILNLSQDIENIFSDRFDISKLSDYTLVGEPKQTEILRILINPQGGLQDMQKPILKAVGNPDNRFQEDALRILRGVRLVNKLNQLLNGYIDFETSTWNSMKKNYYLVGFLAKERLKDELTKIFSLKKPFEAVIILNELNLTSILFPSLESIKNVPQPIRYHALDTYHHSIMTLYHLQDINDDYQVKIAMLLHDVGKKQQYYYAGLRLCDEERNKLHSTYISHPIIGKDMALKDLKNLGFSNSEVDNIGFYIQYHMIALEGGENSIKNKIKKNIGAWGYEKWMNLLDIVEADRLGQYNPIQNDNISSIKNIKNWSQEIFESQGAFSKKDMVIDGNWLMKNFSLKPSKQIGKLLDLAFEWVVVDAENRNNEKSIYDLLKQNI